ncbi:DUF421 domain-containing protein [Rossellomorea aquimaris]|uniref:DUF421 domain-containing protein n=1 Tax=Rossellomorea aquimaris TaxID=189382 RepID=UPI001CD299C3|nr:DUF421 domain-containing protein [Rossellomorea aquimaris]MCA1053917.1 DUF421 domain-containing protein [Rossellomorea aquimaris]
MDVHLIWKAILVVIGGTLLLRIAGRKSISQMSLAQVVIMIGIGSLLVQPIAGKDIWSTLFVGMVLVVSLVVIEYVQIKADWFEAFITGRSKVLIKDGELQIDTLKKLRLTVDQLEMKLRQNGVRTFLDVQEATLEPNGQVGIILNEENSPATKNELNMIKQEIHALRLMISNLPTSGQHVQATSITTASGNKQCGNDLFEEISSKEHKIAPPMELQ